MRQSRFIAAAVLMLATACASVRVQKVTTVNGVETATGPEGIRFYMPRPYVVVNEPFVVGSDVYIVRGHLTPDSQYVLIDDADGDLLTKLGKYIPTEKARALSIPAGKVRIPSIPVPHVGGAQGGEDNANPPDTSAPPAEPKQGEKEPGQSTPSDKKKSGVINAKVENDANAFSLTPLKRYFDIAWLPDFDEQYVVRGKAGFGNASILMRLGQGWSLQGLETTADNSALTGPLVEVWGDAIKSLYALAKTSYGLPAAFVAGAQGAAGEVQTLASAPGGIPVTIKLTIAKVAAPGVYPILKPKEIACLTTTSATTGKDPLACLPLPSDYDKHKGDVLLPVPPLTNVAFNVYELIVLEAAKPTGDSIMGIQRYFDFKSAGAAAGVDSTASTPGVSQALLDQVKTEINNEQNQLADKWEIVDLRVKADGTGNLQAVVKRVGSPKNDKKLLASTISAKLGKLKVPVASKDIDVTEPN